MQFSFCACAVVLFALFADHCDQVEAGFHVILNLKPIKTKQDNYKWLNRKQEYEWDNNSPEKFQRALNSTEVKDMINNCKQSSMKQQTYH